MYWRGQVLTSPGFALHFCHYIPDTLLACSVSPWTPPHTDHPHVPVTLGRQEVRTGINCSLDKELCAGPGKMSPSAKQHGTMAGWKGCCFDAPRGCQGTLWAPQQAPRQSRGRCTKLWQWSSSRLCFHAWLMDSSYQHQELHPYHPWGLGQPG